MTDRWRLRSGLVWLAYIALAVQGLVVAPHVHIGANLSHRIALQPAHGAAGGGHRQLPPCNHDHDTCPACIALHAGSGVIPLPPAILAPREVAIDLGSGPGAWPARVAARSPFSARAPPA